jgi:xylulose-5-phosphate/fructose-6-phosphate phosphoketolase
MADERLRHRAYTRQVGDDAPEVRDWVWPGSRPPAQAATDAQRGQPA